MSLQTHTATSTLLQLASSWDQRALLLSDLSAKELPHHLTLTSAEGKPHIAVRQPSTFGWLFSWQSAASEFAKVNRLFREATDMRAEFLQLEKNLNAIGRDLYIEEKNSLLASLQTINFSDFQIRPRLNTVLPPSTAEITKTLPNPKLTICWLNSAVKYLAATSHYDKALSTVKTDPDTELLRQKLFSLIEALREDHSQPIIDTLHEELLAAFKSEKFSPYLQGYQDVNDFLLIFRKHDEKTTDFSLLIRTAKVYKNNDIAAGIQKVAEEHPSDFQLPLSSTEEEIIDIDKTFSKIELLEGCKGYKILRDGVWQEATELDEPRDFLEQNVCLYLPEVIEVWLSRTIVHDKDANVAFASQQKINIDEKGELSLSEYSYDPQAEIKLKATHIYRVQAAIERTGLSGKQGHFVTHLRQADGTICRHSDTKITKDPSEEAWKSAFFLLLKRTAKIDAPVEQQQG